jgi:opacity protein-like surface antigen
LQQKQYVVAGLHYQPLKGVSVKLDYVYRVTGEYNKALYVTNPYATNTPFYTNYQFINLGIGYSF